MLACLVGTVFSQPHLRIPDEAKFLEQFANGNGLPQTEDPSDSKFINHELMLGAARASNGVGYVKYDVDLADDHQYTLELGVEVEGNLVVLDDLSHDALHSFGEGGDDIYLNPGAREISEIKRGDHIIGSHEGRWNDLITLEQPLQYGVRLGAKRVVNGRHSRALVLSYPSP